MSGTDTIEIPIDFAESEKIIRGIFSPYNFKKGNTLKHNVFYLRSNEEGVSVIRLNYSNIQECKQHLKKIQKPQVKKNYYGVALLFVSSIISSSVPPVELRMKHTPQPDLPAHAEILYFINGVHFSSRQSGEQMPSEITVVIDKLMNCSRLVLDPNPDNEHWDGEEI